jgi:hypothetical protein
MTAGPRRSSGRDEQMFGDEQQIPHGRQTDQESEVRQPGLIFGSTEGALHCELIAMLIRLVSLVAYWLRP